MDYLSHRSRGKCEIADTLAKAGACKVPEPSASLTVEKTATSCLAEGHLGLRHPLRVLPLTSTHRRLRLKWCHARGNWTAAEWNYAIFSDESRFNLSSDDNRVRVWRPRGERLNPAFSLQ
ncbi:transposable element Tcb1 transposase [Trichonephila clavipes]|nr:transposable element Tcb1 transposase [Trichonephila clavipes]